MRPQQLVFRRRGHRHPQIRLPGLERRLPAFWLRERMLVLPAFSLMTGGTTPRLCSPAIN